MSVNQKVLSDQCKNRAIVTHAHGTQYRQKRAHGGRYKKIVFCQNSTVRAAVLRGSVLVLVL